ERLEDVRGNRNLQGGGIDLLSNAQPFAKAGLLDFQVKIEELHLATQRDLVLLGSVKVHAKKIAERANHLLRGDRLSSHQRDDGVKRVKKEVGLELRLERLQIRLRKARFQFQGP